MGSVAEHLEGEKLPGKQNDFEWTVIEKHTVKSSHSPGAFSIGYRVKNQHGHEAFMKASDLGLMTIDDADFVERLQVALQAHRTEKKMLDRCRGNNMDRVVVAIDYGHLMVEVNGKRDAIFFLVFELAKCDVRIQVDQLKRFELVWCLTALHDLAVAIQQLHQGTIAHNDIKPANMLVFDEALQKLADLGHATSAKIPSVYEEEHCIGDERYAAPEYLYQLDDEELTEARQFRSRRAGDLYNLASMTFYLLSGTMLTPQICRKLRIQHRPNLNGDGWEGTFQDVLPYWRKAFNDVIEDLRTVYLSHPKQETEIIRELLDFVVQLGEPNPSERGHPLEKSGSQDELSVRRYVSRLSELKQQAAIAA